jgi:tryptophan-rich sensory protein
MNLKKLGKLLSSIGIVLAAGLLGSIVTFPSIPTWYSTLIKPPLSPPNWVFGPVWTTLYILMGISLYLVWNKGLQHAKVRFAFQLFIVHLAVNAGWSVVFFGLHSILGGLIVIIILWTLIAVLIRKFYPIDKRAAYLLVPYILWVSIATILNISLFLLNP